VLFRSGLNQLGEKLGGIVLNVIGGMCLTSGVRDDARTFVDAYANQGLQVEDFTGIKAREELMIRFPVAGRDMGAISAIPRERPAGQPAPAQHQAYKLPPYIPRTSDEANALALLDDLERGVTELQAQIARDEDPTNAPATDQSDSMFAETVYRAVANRWLDRLHPALVDALRSAEPRPAETQLRELAWGEIQTLIHDLREVSTRRAHAWADALAVASAAHHAADDYLTQLSQYRYGVNPIVNACFAAALVRQYETDELTMAHQERRQKQRPNQAAGPPPQIAPPSTQRSAIVVPVPTHPTLARSPADPSRSVAAGDAPE
jgi:hypothetical protein